MATIRVETFAGHRAVSVVITALPEPTLEHLIQAVNKKIEAVKPLLRVETFEGNKVARVTLAALPEPPARRLAPGTQLVDVPEDQRPDNWFLGDVF